MKQIKVIICILLVVLLVGAWASLFVGSDVGKKREYKSDIESASDFMSRGLYQKAIEQYKLAIDIEDSEDLHKNLLNAYSKRYKESKDIFDDYLTEAKSSVSAYPGNADFLIKLADLYIIDNDYKKAYKCLTTAKDKNVKADKEVAKLTYKVKYSFDKIWTSYKKFSSFSNGYYAVDSSDVWTYINDKGEEDNFGSLEYAGPVGDDGIRVALNDDVGQLIDNDKVVQGKMKIKPASAGVYSDGLVPVSDGKTYSYYDLLGDKQFGNYEYAGSFSDGKAIVKDNKECYFINKKGKKVSNETFDSILLDKNGCCSADKKYVAEKDNKYFFINESGKILSEIKFDKLDMITADNMIAYKKGDKWGYMDADGKTVIEPKFNEAKSFSNGLGAVYNGIGWGFIDKDGKLAIGYQFADTDYFNNKGSCLVETGGGNWQIISLFIWDSNN